MRLVEFREERGWSQAQLARRLGRSQPTVQRWEAGLSIPGRVDIARLFDLSDGRVTPNDFHDLSSPGPDTGTGATASETQAQGMAA